MFLRPTRTFFSHMERLPLPVEGFKFWLILDIHDHWTVRDFSVLYVLWHGASVYNGHLRGTITLTTVAERLEKELSLLVFTTYVCSDRDSNIQPSAIEANALIDCTTAVVRMLSNTFYVLLFFFLSTFSPKRNLNWLVENKIFNHRALLDCNIIRPVIVRCTLI